jgi:hypothetical protein
MTQIPVEPLVPDNSLITDTPEEGRALAILLAILSTPCRGNWRC